MDYSVKELAALAQALLSRSASFEPHVPGGEKTPFEALEELGTLGALTAESLTPTAKPAEAPVATSLAAEAPVSVPLPPPTKADYQSMKIPSRYEGKNLQDDSLLRALVDFHKIHAPVLGAKSGSPKATEKNAPAEETRASPRSAGFSPAEIPIIDAHPKNDSNMKRSTRPTAPVLRTRRDDPTR